MLLPLSTTHVSSLTTLPSIITPPSGTAFKATYAATTSSNNHSVPSITETSTIPFPLPAPLGLPIASTPNLEKLTQEQPINNTPLPQPTPLMNTSTLPCLFEEPFSTQSA